MLCKTIHKAMLRSLLSPQREISDFRHTAQTIGKAAAAAFMDIAIMAGLFIQSAPIVEQRRHQRMTEKPHLPAMGMS